MIFATRHGGAKVGLKAQFKKSGPKRKSHFSENIGSKPLAWEACSLPPTTVMCPSNY